MAEEVEIHEFKLEEIPLSCTWVIIGNPGSGKCKKKGTQVLMFDGKLEKVECLKIGDLLMGDDSKPREITKLFNGVANMFEIIPQDDTGSYFVTGNHTLCLKYNTSPMVIFDKGRWPRYRVRYPQMTKNSDGLTKVNIKHCDFSVGKLGESKAKKLAEEFCAQMKLSTTKMNLYTSKRIY
jgi:hypothetical protein